MFVYKVSSFNKIPVASSFGSSDRAHQGLYEKYASLARFVDKLEPSTVTSIYKEHKNAQTFYPGLGIFFNEFALVYASNTNKTK